MKNGVLLAVFSSLIFSIMNVLVKAVSVNIPTAEVVFFRSIIGALVVLFMMRQSKVFFSKNGVPLLVTRGILGALYLLAYFYAIANMPLTDASILVHLSPIFVVILSSIFLSEKLSKGVVPFVILALLGAILLVKPFHYSTYSLVAIVGVLSALFAAGASISIRLLTKSHHKYEIIFYFLATATLVSIPLMWHNFVIPSFIDLLYLIGIALISLLGLIVLTTALTHENVIIVEIVRYIGIFFNAIWGFVFWVEIPDYYTLLGGALIIGACIALSKVRERPINLTHKQVAK
ncbi:DMT family transporter [Anaerobacillus alkaliphilus]|uniref:DMT family transporter n=1 Tax=Anaerobacillus alkaliphilus TaxID=1548597 RepID=A0A4Q0VWK3_9BACI|nr:DMT family transporter [Anaerobacillus alkaliphilus]RXJ04014.1 DMT family transporter [Anaerobacillus alkaliphilus]